MYILPYIHYVSALALICVVNNVVIFVARFLLVDQYSEQISIIKIKLFFLITYPFNCVNLIIKHFTMLGCSIRVEGLWFCDV